MSPEKIITITDINGHPHQVSADYHPPCDEHNGLWEDIIVIDQVTRKTKSNEFVDCWEYTITRALDRELGCNETFEESML